MHLAGNIEHTLLQPDCSLSDIKKLCEEALRYKYGAVCIPPYYVKDAAYILDERLRIVTVVGFPMGYSAIPAKVEEIKRAIDEGADEIDLVINHCAVKSGTWSAVRNEIDGTARAVAMKGKIFKTVIEPGMLTPDEIARLGAICSEVEVNYMCLGTGFHGYTAQTGDISLVRKSLNPRIKIKATGDFRTANDLTERIEAGAHRLGVTATTRLIK